MTALKLGKNAANAFAIHVSLPRGITELKSYCKVNGGRMVVSESELSFAMSAGLGAMMECGLVEISSDTAMSVAPVSVPVPVKETSAESPKTALQMTVDIHVSEGGDLEGDADVKATEAAPLEEIKAEETKVEAEEAPDAPKSRRRRV